MSILILAPVLVRGQSGRVRTAPDSRISLPPIAEQPPTSDLRRHITVTPPGFSEMTRAAGTIFSGTVISVARRPAMQGQAVETVAITFHIESAFRGAIPGEDLTISQWIGLWSGGQRYRVGERVMLFLYPPSKLGLTSCVASGMGRFTIDRWGRVLLSAQHISAFRKDPVLGGRSLVRISDFAWAGRRASEEE